MAQGSVKSVAAQPAVARFGEPYRVMVVDDSVVIRSFVTRMLESDPEIKVVESVSNGELAVRVAKRTPLDAVILDIEMPVMDGLTALPHILKANAGVKVIMLSTLTRRNASVSMRALALGAADYMPKPMSVREVGASSEFKRELVDKVKALVTSACKAEVRRSAPVPLRTVTPAAPPVTRAPGAVSGLPTGQRPPAYEGAPIVARSPSREQPDVLVIGSSTGGPQALFTVFRALKSKVRVPTLITQHMPPTFTTILAEHLQRVAGLRCAEARDNEAVESNRIYVAPGDYHMLIERRGTGIYIRLNNDAPINFCRPAVDPLFASAAKIYGSRVLAILLTGMGHDGLKGGQEVVDAGGTLLAQDETTSVVWGMPGAVATAGLCSAVLPIQDIGPRIHKLAAGSPGR